MRRRTQQRGSMARNRQLLLSTASLAMAFLLSVPAFAVSISQNNAAALASQAVVDHDADTERALGLFAEKNGPIKVDDKTSYSAASLYQDAIKDGNDVAVVDLHRLTTQGDVDAMIALGGLYMSGEADAVPQDQADAVRLFTSAARKGSPIAKFNLAAAEMTGSGTPQDISSACENFLGSATLGFEPAVHQTLSCLPKMPDSYALDAFSMFKRTKKTNPIAKLAYAQMLLGDRPFDPAPEKSVRNFLEVFQGSDKISDENLAWAARAIAEYFIHKDSLPQFLAYMKKAAAYGDKRAPDDILGTLVAEGKEPDVVKNLILNDSRTADEDKVLTLWKRVRSFDVKSWRCGVVPTKPHRIPYMLVGWRKIWAGDVMNWQDCTIRHINSMKYDLQSFDDDLQRYPFKIPLDLIETIQKIHVMVHQAIDFETNQVSLAGEMVQK